MLGNTIIVDLYGIIVFDRSETKIIFDMSGIKNNISW